MSSSMRLFFVGLVAVGLQGCAAIFTGTSQQISLQSSVPDTKFFVNGRPVGKGSSALATIRKKDLRKTILLAQKEGCEDATAPVDAVFNGHTLWGMFWDLGLISVLVVDGAATGAWTKAGNTHYYLDPNCPKAAQ